jgi:hypothetical protein
VTVCKVCAEAISLSKRPASCMESIWLCFCPAVEVWSLGLVTLKAGLCVFARNFCLLCSSAVSPPLVVRSLSRFRKSATKCLFRL